MFGRIFVNAHNFVYIPKPGGSYATYTVQDTAQLEGVLRPTRPPIRRQNTYPCVVSSPQAKEPVKIEPLIGTADTGLYLAQQSILKLGLRYTGHDEMTRQGLAKIYSGVSLRFDADHNGGSCRYTFIQVYELPESQRTVSVADPSANVKRDGILGLPQLGNHIVLSLRGDIFLIDRQMCIGTIIEDVFPPLSPYDYLLTPSIPSSTTAVLSYPVEPPASFLIVTLAEALALLPPVHRDIIVAASELTSSFGSSHASTTIQFTRPQRPIVPDTCQTCERSDTALRICKLCVDERRGVRAVYCSKQCQAQDWDARHRAEHGKHVHRSGILHVEPVANLERSVSLHTNMVPVNVLSSVDAIVSESIVLRDDLSYPSQHVSPPNDEPSSSSSPAQEPSGLPALT